MINIITAFSRFENYKHYKHYFKMFSFVNWFPILQIKQLNLDVVANDYNNMNPIYFVANASDNINPCYYKLNQFIKTFNINADDWYCFLNDDDWLPADLLNFVEFRATKDLLFCEMLRGWNDSTGHGTTRLKTDNLTVYNVGVEQIFIKGKILIELKNNNTLFLEDCEFADGLFIEYVSKSYDYETTEKAALFNFFDKERWNVYKN
jgi:hypothetical protein